MRKIITIVICVLIISSLFSGIGVVNAQNNGSVDASNLVFVADNDGVTAYDESLDVFWSIDRDDVSEIEINNGSSVYIAYNNGSIESVNSFTGDSKWLVNDVYTGVPNNGLAVNINNEIYSTINSGEIAKLNPNNGSIIDTSNPNGDIRDMSPSKTNGDILHIITDREFFERYAIQWNHDSKSQNWEEQLFEAGDSRSETIISFENSVGVFSFGADFALLNINNGDSEYIRNNIDNYNTHGYASSKNTLYTDDTNEINKYEIDGTDANIISNNIPKMGDAEAISIYNKDNTMAFGFGDELYSIDLNSESITNDVSVNNIIDTASISGDIDEPPSPTSTINFNVNNFMPLNSEQSYTVELEQLGSSIDITNEANVSSNNPNIIEVNESNNLLISNNSGTATIEVNYEDDSITTNITVAPLTINNIEDMPSTYWVHAVLGIGESDMGIGSEIQWVLLTILLGATAANISRNEWLGNGVIIAQLILYWVMGNISLGLVITGVFYGIFITLYIRQIPSRTVLNMPDNQGGNGGFE